jgi:hypothetical protein
MKIVLNIKEVPAGIIQKVLKEEYNINVAIYNFIEDAKESTLELQKDSNSIVPFWERKLLFVPIDSHLPGIVLWNDVWPKDSKYKRIEDIEFLRSSSMLIDIIESQQNKEDWKFNDISGSPCVIEILDNIDYEILTHGEFGYEYGIQQKTPKWTIWDLKKDNNETFL